MFFVKFQAFIMADCSRITEVVNTSQTSLGHCKTHRKQLSKASHGVRNIDHFIVFYNFCQEISSTASSMRTVGCDHLASLSSVKPRYYHLRWIPYSANTTVHWCMGSGLRSWFRLCPMACGSDYADDCLHQRCQQHRCYIVATCDKDLKRRIRKVPGVPIMYINSRKYSIERMPEAFGAPSS